MNNTNVTFSNMIKTEEELIKIKEKIFEKFNVINTDLETIDKNWDGKKSNETLKNIEDIKKEYNDILKTLENIIVNFNIAYNNYKEATSQGIIDSSTTSNQTNNNIVEETTIIQDNSNILNETTNINTTGAIDTNVISFSEFNSQLADYAIQATLKGENPLMSFNFTEMMINFNLNPNTTKRDSAYLQEAAISLNELQTKMKDAGIWGTDKAPQVTLFWQLKTGFRPAAKGSTTTDGLGNFRYVGINSNWDKSGQGLDCTNYALWTQTNSGNVAEGKVINRNPRKADYNDNYSDSSSITQKYNAGDPVSYVGTNGRGHTGMYLGTQNGYAYTIESISGSYGGGSGPVIRIRPLDGNTLPKELEKYKNSSFSIITKWQDLLEHGQIVDPKNNAAFQNQHLVIKTN
ncbi:MAG: hypothetical protein PHC42_00915 [Bacilli bacterium]|nr:hypothetical protein [Bacilli bacterium]